MVNLTASLKFPARSIHAIMTICDYVLLNSALFPVLLGSVKGICQRLMPAIGAEPNLAGFDLGPELAAAQALIDGAGTAPALPMRERCPACDDLFQVQSPWQAVCHNGHEWERCSVTIAVVDTPYARICVGCNRRTLLPGYFEEGKDRAGPSILSELLRGYDQCLYCGERLSLTLKMPS